MALTQLGRNEDLCPSKQSAAVGRQQASAGSLWLADPGQLDQSRQFLYEQSTRGPYPRLQRFPTGQEWHAGYPDGRPEELATSPLCHQCKIVGTRHAARTTGSGAALPGRRLPLRTPAEARSSTVQRPRQGALGTLGHGSGTAGPPGRARPRPGAGCARLERGHRLRHQQHGGRLRRQRPAQAAAHRRRQLLGAGTSGALREPHRPRVPRLPRASGSLAERGLPPRRVLGSGALLARRPAELPRQQGQSARRGQHPDQAQALGLA